MVASKGRDGVEAALPAGVRVFAIGDIHGRLDLLEALFDKIDAYQEAARVTAAPLIVCLGDYVDRGPDSRGVIDFLLERQAGGAEMVFLKGNHEVMFEETLLHGVNTQRWIMNGGGAALESYGFGALAWRDGGSLPGDTRETILNGMPPEHLEFLRTARLSYELGDYFFAHAGVRPGVPLEEQTEDDLLWIRGEFLEHTGGFSKVVVHGHTPARTPDARTNRIGIDTGAFFTGRLTALVLEGTKRTFLHT